MHPKNSHGLGGHECLLLSANKIKMHMPSLRWIWLCHNKPAIAQLAEHLTVDICRYQMVPGSIPGGRSSLSCGHDCGDVRGACIQRTVMGLEVMSVSCSANKIYQLAEHLTVDMCRYQMVPGSIPGGRSSLSCGHDCGDVRGACIQRTVMGLEVMSVSYSLLTK